MFFNAQNSQFPFQMPNMNGQTPFPFPFQMPNMNGQTPFPFPFFNPFQTCADKPEDEEAAPEGEAAQTDAQQQCNPFAFFQQMGQMPQMQQFMDMWKNMFGAFGMNPQNCCQQGFNPFGCFQMPNMNAQMQQLMDMWKNMFGAFGMNPQNCCQQGFNPFGCFQMPNMNAQMQQFMDMWKNMFAAFCPKGDKQDNGLPFGMPIKLLQLLLHMDSNPDGLSKLQKILDLIFDAYSKPRTPAEE